MSIFEFHYHELDNAIDERIERSNNIRDEWGTKIFDSEGRLRSSEDFPLEPYTLLSIIQYQQEQITDLEYNFSVAWKDLTHYKDECRKLKTAFNSDISSLDIRIEGLEKEVQKL